MQPSEIPRPPGLQARVNLAMSQQEGSNLLPLSGSILHRSLAGADQVTHSLMSSVRYPDLRQFTGTEQPGEFLGIAAVRLDPIARLARDQLKREIEALGHECAVIAPSLTVSGGSSLIAKSQSHTWASELADETAY